MTIDIIRNLVDILGPSGFGAAMLVLARYLLKLWAWRQYVRDKQADPSSPPPPDLGAALSILLILGATLTLLQAPATQAIISSLRPKPAPSACPDCGGSTCKCKNGECICGAEEKKLTEVPHSIHGREWSIFGSDIETFPRRPES